MEEEVKKVEEVKQEPDILEIAKKRTEDLEKANKELEEQLKKHDRLMAETIVRGKSFAGQKEKTFDDEINEEAERIANSLHRTFRSNTV